MDLKDYSRKELQEISREKIERIHMRNIFELLEERITRLERGDLDEWVGPAIDRSPTVVTTANDQYTLFQTTVE